MEKEKTIFIIRIIIRIAHAILYVITGKHKNKEV